jgi:hypothetical protein
MVILRIVIAIRKIPTEEIIDKAVSIIVDPISSNFSRIFPQFGA